LPALHQSAPWSNLNNKEPEPERMGE
jgi:hypothetical protein